MAINIVNKKYHTPTDHDFPIHKGTILGNPFTHLPPGKSTQAQFFVETRDEAIDKYEEYFKEKIAARDYSFLTELRRLYKMAKKGDVNLVCYCYPSRCHGEIIKKFIEDKL